ncbi:putative acyl-activating enzyme 19 [Zingiber officinale]|uniref:putative acyl-activating enzyme 19 n=1 Tax=Zingiber officinale TaxID=94328 RepID=UPI001C4B55EB|nr:putative acyl-activating enzyme 19 [Zingiber officinale]
MPSGDQEGIPADGAARCCISHGFFESASKNPSRIAFVHASGSHQRQEEAVRALTSKETSYPPIYPGDVCFTSGDVLYAVESYSRRIRRVLDGGDDADLVRPQGCDRENQIDKSVTLDNDMPHVVGVCIPPSVEYIVAVLAILRCGEAFLPLDPSWPESRLLSVISSSNTSLILQCVPSHETLQYKAAEWIVKRSSRLVLYINLFLDHKKEIVRSELIWPCERSPRRFCYVMYTSGSTGKPKGVCGTEEGLLNRFQWMQGLIPLCNMDILLFKTSISFIDHLQEFFGATLTSTPLIILPVNDIKANPLCLVDFVKAYKISRMTCVPSLMRLVLPKLEDSYFRSSNPLKVLILSGEILSVPLCSSLQEYLPWTTILNLYGSTEVSGDCTYFDCKKLADVLDVEPLSSVPIGFPISNCETVLVGQPDCPDEGEIYVSGVCLFAGYHDNMNNDPMGKSSVSQFQTGDFARRLRSGDLVFLGRHDRTVKINGQRVALEEIESAMKDHPEINDAAVTYHGSNGVATQLEAYFVMKSSEGFKKNHRPLDKLQMVESLIPSIRSWLQKKLPSVMIPSYYFCMESLPILDSGKINHLELSSSVSTPKQHVSPFGRNSSSVNQLQTIKDVFCDALLVKEVADDDDFFTMGGTSISAALASYKLQIDMRLIYMFPTPVKLLNRLIEDKELHENLISPDPIPRKRLKAHANVLDSSDFITGNAESDFLLPEPSPSLVGTRVHDLSAEHNVQLVYNYFEGSNNASGMCSELVVQDPSLFPDSHHAASGDHGPWNSNCNIHKMCSFSRCNKIMHEVDSYMVCMDKSWLTIRTPRSIKGSLQELWKIPLKSCVDASPLIVIADGKWYLFIGSHSHMFLCIEPLSGSVRWQVLLDSRIECSAAITGDFSQVVVGCYKGKIYFLDFANGTISWYFQTDGEVKMQPVVERSRNLIWCGSHDHSLYALDYKEHCCVYKVSCGGSLFGSPFFDVVHNMLYVASTSGRVTAISSVALPFDIVWTFEAGAPIFGSLTMDSKCRIVICCLVDGYVLALSFSGAVVWKAHVGGPIFAGACISSVLADKILICSRNGKLYSFDMEGTIHWEYDTRDPITSSAYVDEHTELVSDPSCPNDRLACICSSSGSIHLIRISAEAKREAGRSADAATPMVEQFAVAKLPGDIFSSPVMVGGRIFVGCRDDYVHCLTVVP